MRMHDKTAELAERLAALHAEYMHALPGKMFAIASAWRSLADIGWDAMLLADLHRMVHGLSGSGTTFGLDAVSDAARVLEQQLKRAVGADMPPTGQERAQLNAAVQRLQEVVEAAATDSVRAEHAGAAAQLSASVAVGKIGPLIVVDDADDAAHLAAQLRYHRYDVQLIKDLSGLDDAVRHYRPAALLIAVDHGEGGAVEAAGRLRKLVGPPLSLVFLSRTGDLPTRLRAVRAGGSAFFVKPIDITALVDSLDALLAPRVEQPERILIIDDSAPLAAYYAALLRHAGMIVDVETDPLQAQIAIDKFSPDLILMDVHMPNCTGLELSAIIRQQPEYVAIPIVFLSSETDVAKQLEALGLGADDFLTKPIEPDHLLRAVATRASRARTLRRYMLRDSLTGVLNHTAITERLASEIVRARRQGSPLSFAILDIDHFKEVNDRYGHQAGDRVLKELARLLSVHTRGSDCVGRLGGEEFAVILVDTEPAVGRKLLDGLRTAFSAIHFRHGTRSFGVRFSGGITGVENGATATNVVEKADKAMYEAKRSGRNCVVLAS
jgi:diguanylate cyclase (GGDEF)-like protein